MTCVPSHTTERTDLSLNQTRQANTQSQTAQVLSVSYNTTKMKPLALSSNTPVNIDADFHIDWLNLVSSGMTLDKEDDIAYLSEIKKY
ncbi:MAG: hypothetical protein ACKVTZ_09095, partial [Bacteroidia bacterium]